MAVFRVLWVGIILALVIASVAWLEDRRTKDALPEPADEVLLAEPTAPPPERAGVVEILDALTVRLDTGHRVRYLGVRTPTADTCFGDTALEANRSMLGMAIRMEEDPVLSQSQDGAWLRYVYLSDATKPELSLAGTPSPEMVPATSADTTPTLDPSESQLPEENVLEEIFVNERIIEGGFGFLHASEGMIYADRLQAAARYSSATGKGLWSRCAVSKDAATDLLMTQPLDDEGAVVDK